MAKPKLAIIGAGTVGTALAVGLTRKGYTVTAVSSRTIASAERLSRMVGGCAFSINNQSAADAAQVIFITTPDAAIPQVASEVSWRPGQGAVHCSGADSTETLEPARKAGAFTGGFHPLQTFATIEQAINNLPGTTFAIESREPLLTDLKDMAVALGGRHIELRAQDKVLYHTSAVIACNYLVTLVKMATDLWQTFGMLPGEAIHALMPLLRGTLNNLETVGLPNCLTGPVARGDLGTIKKHISDLQKAYPSLLHAYRILGVQTVPIALAKGKIDATRANEVRALLAGTEAAGQTAPEVMIGGGT